MTPLHPLQLGDLVLVASRVLGKDTGATLDLLDLHAAGTAMAARAPGDPDDPAGRAAALLRALVLERPFRQANDQIALLATVQFLTVNGWDADLDPPEETEAVLASVATGALGAAGLADWLAPRLQPRKDTDLPDDATHPMEERAMPGWLPRRPSRGKWKYPRFTERARRVVEELAPEEARALDHGFVGTEHLLLGMLQMEEGLAAKALVSMDISLADVRAQVEEIIGQGQKAPAGEIPLSPRAKKVLELSLREALHLGHNYIGTEHILLGLLREGEGVAALVLVKLGGDLPSVRGRVIQLLSGYTGAGGPGPGGGMDTQTLIAESLRLHREVERLRGLLRRHGVDPEEGTSRSA